jgi:Toprim-like/CHC2 zinc finger
MKKLSCREAKQMDLVAYLEALGHSPSKIKGPDYWYLSPLRKETTPSFKVNRTRNVWFDFGEGKGGDIIDFGVNYFRCSIGELLERLSSKLLSRNFSFHPPAIGGEKEASPGKISILEERSLRAPVLLKYLQKRCIPLEIARQHCTEVDFKLYGRIHTAIGFRNNKGGFELRNEAFKGSSSPKAITFFDKGAGEVAVFEGFFDFLSFHTLQVGKSNPNTNFLVLNSLAFFHQAKDVMDRHQRVNLYLDRNAKGIECTKLALGWDEKKYNDLSKQFQEGQDLNDWLIQRQNYLSSKLIYKPPGYHRGKGRKI